MIRALARLVPLMARNPTLHSSSWLELPRSARRFVVIVWLLACLELALSLFRLDRSNLPLGGMAFFATATTISGLFTTDLARRQGQGLTVSTESAWQMAVALIFPAPLAVLTGAMGALGANIADWGRPWYKRFFNIANAILSMAFASWVFHGLTEAGDALWVTLMAGLATGATYYLINTALVEAVVAFAIGRSPVYIWRISFATVLVHQTSMICLSGLIAFVWIEYRLAVILVAIPLLAIQIAMRQVSQLKNQIRSTLLPDVSLTRLLEIDDDPLRLLGLDQGRVFYHGTPLRPGRLRSASARELLFYLAEHVQGSTLEKICGDLWPDAFPERARNQFHTAVYRIRHATNKTVIVHGSGIYQLNRLGLWYDAAQFRSYIEKSQSVSDNYERIDFLKGAVALCRTEYLPDVYSDWAQRIRLTLLHQQIDAYSTLAHLYYDSGEYEKAEATALGALEKDPQHEPLYQVLMLIGLQVEGPAAAVRWYARCCEALKDMDVGPSESTVALYRQKVLPLLAKAG